MNLNAIIDLYDGPQSWPTVAAALVDLHQQMANSGAVTLEAIVKQNLPPSDEQMFARVVARTVDNAQYAKNNQPSQPGFYPIGRYSDGNYHSYAQTRAGVIDTLVLAKIYNKTLAPDDVFGRYLVDCDLTILTAAMCGRDYKRGLGPESPEFEVQIGAARALVSTARNAGLGADVMRDCALLALATGAMPGRFDVRAMYVMDDDVLQAVDGLTDTLWGLHRGGNPRLRALTELAAYGTRLDTMACGRDAAEQAISRLASEIALVTRRELPEFQSQRYKLAQLGGMAYDPHADLPHWYNYVTDYAPQRLWQEYRHTVVTRLRGDFDGP